MPARREDLSTQGGSQVEANSDVERMSLRSNNLPRPAQEAHGGSISSYNFRKDFAENPGPKRQRRDPGDSVSYACDEADCKSLKFYSKAQWTKHVNKHLRPFKCSEGCGRDFARNSCRQRHEVAVHFPDEKYLCTQPECQKAGIGFTRRDHLTQHMKTHAVQTSATLHTPRSLEHPFPDVTLLQKNADLGPRKRRLDTTERDGSDAEDNTLSVLQILREQNERMKAELRKLQETLDSISMLIRSKSSQ